MEGDAALDSDINVKDVALIWESLKIVFKSVLHKLLSIVFILSFLYEYVDCLNVCIAI